MFSAYCDRCGSEVLLSSRRIVSLRHTDGGILVIFRCWEGHAGWWLTGRRATSQPATGQPGTAGQPATDATGRRRERVTAAGHGPGTGGEAPGDGRAYGDEGSSREPVAPGQIRLTDVWREPRPARI